MSGWDTSALLKLYLQEADSAIFTQLAASPARIAISAIARYEMEAVFRRKEADGAIPMGEADVFQRQLDEDAASGTINSIPLGAAVGILYSDVLKRCLARTPPVFVRASDALHIATALAEGETQFVTADGRQRDAATLVGLRVLP